MRPHEAAISGTIHLRETIMNTQHKFLVSAFAALMLAACASGPPPATEFPAGAKAPSAAEIANLLRGKSFNIGGSNPTRVDYAKEGNASTIYFPGRADNGTWRTEDGRLCYDNFSSFKPLCNDIRLVGNDIYVKRANGQVVQAVPR